MCISGRAVRSCRGYGFRAHGGPAVRVPRNDELPFCRSMSYISATMLDAAFKAIAQMFTPPFRTVLLKSIGLAILMLVLFVIGLHRVFDWLAAEGARYLEGLTGPG